MQPMKQQCRVWLILVAVVVWLYIRQFPSISSAMGLGEVSDKAAEVVVKSRAKVTLYTALGCPFCPLMVERLEALRSRELAAAIGGRG